MKNIIKFDNLKIDNNKYYIRAYRDKQSPASSMLLIKLEDHYVIIFFILYILIHYLL